MVFKFQHNERVITYLGLVALHGSAQEILNSALFLKS